ncbi:tetratricopeptide repeat protein [Sphingosinicella soli]|uniref:Ancillary SecYEG translocon subunit/Cell division coordinator CpoB TPR domain-containing protein n=1 Tax=Sphingosinicella soli TaxID=333708 RepID=A0A7W7F805_9SPHN|nr:tetratricopeptide repeat protein [Sphingosinicella soli]MBB4633229.1 hypothetical protein [Sphingosinicella soli]
MAREPSGTAPEDAFIREVDEEVRKDQLAGFWNRFGRWIVIVVGGGLVALAGFLWWREDQVRKIGVLSEEYSTAQQGLELGNAKAVEEIERFATGNYGGYTALARFTQASRAVENGDNAAALAAYQALAADKKLPQPLRDLASITAVRVEFDTLAPAEIVNRLKPLAQPGAPWFGVAGEMLAVAYINEGKPELAGPIFSAISSDETIAPSLRQRAQQLAASLGSLPDAEVPDAEVPADPVPAPVATTGKN